MGDNVIRYEINKMGFMRPDADGWVVRYEDYKELLDKFNELTDYVNELHDTGSIR